MAAVLDSQESHAKLWYWGWSGIYGGIIIGESIVNATSSGGARASAQVNIVTSSFGMFSTLIFPPPVAVDWDGIRNMPASTDEQRAAKSAAIRALFAKEVGKERFYHSAINHIFGLAANAAVCAYVYWGLHIGGRALLNLLAGSLVWEANIFTSPNASMHLADELPKTTSLQLQLVPMVSADAAGVAVLGRF